MKDTDFNMQLLKGIKNMHELGRQKCFELGNPYYAKEKGDGDHYTKELPNGDRFLVDVEIICDENGFGVEIIDTILCKKDDE